MPTILPSTSELSRSNSVHNFIVLTGDASAWFFGMAFIDLLTVLPLFFQRASEALAAQQGGVPFYLKAQFLTSFAVTIRGGGWLIPQLFSARWISRSRYKKPALILACWAGRLPFAAAAAYLLSPGSRADPRGSILIVMAAWAIFSVTEGFSGVPWFCIVSKAVPARRRGGLFGGVAAIGGFLAASSGVVVRTMLGPHAPAFPRNFGILFTITFTLLMVSQIFLYLIREPADEETTRVPPGILDYFRHMPELVRKSRPFQRQVVVQWLGSVGGLAAPLYTLFATSQLHLPDQVVGRFLTASMIGSVVGSLGCGLLNDRFSPRFAIHSTLAMAVLTPWIALSAAVIPEAANGASPLVTGLFALSFFLSGAVANGGFTGYTNYLMETTPEANRGEYVGLMNTLNSPAVAMPILGTFIAAHSSARIVFALAGLGCLAALATSFSLPRPSRGI